MAQNTTIIKNTKFSNTDTILVELDNPIIQPGYQVVVGGAVRQDLVDSVELDAADPGKKFTVRLSSPQTGRVQVYEDDRRFFGLPTPREALEIQRGRSGWSYTRSFGDSSKDYAEGKYSSWSVLASFVFPGVGVVSPEKLTAILSRSGSSGESKVRLVVLSTRLVVCEIAYNDEDTAIYNAAVTLGNLPAGQTILEIQASRSGGKTRIHYAELK